MRVEGIILSSKRTSFFSSWQILKKIDERGVVLGKRTADGVCNGSNITSSPSLGSKCEALTNRSTLGADALADDRTFRNRAMWDINLSPWDSHFPMFFPRQENTDSQADPGTSVATRKCSHIMNRRGRLYLYPQTLRLCAMDHKEYVAMRTTWKS